MENPSYSGEASKNTFSRRTLLRRAAATVAGLTIVPRHVLGGPGYVPPSDKVNIAFIGTGSQGLRVMLHFLREADVQAVAVCDPNQQSADYAQWAQHEFRDAVRKLLGTSTGWDWLSPEDPPIQLTHSLRVTSGVAGRDPCQKIVDAYYGTQKRSGEYHACAAYKDFRELLEKEKDVDAVVVGTTDNLHAAVSAATMRKGKHVFCQKPMTHTLYEARCIADIARETAVATQVAVNTRVCCANGFGPALLDLFGRSSTGRAALSGPRASNAPRKCSRCPSDWIGTCGLARRRSALSTMPTCPSYGAAGTTSAAGPSAIWAATALILFSVC